MHWVARWVGGSLVWWFGGLVVETEDWRRKTGDGRGKVAWELDYSGFFKFGV